MITEHDIHDILPFSLLPEAAQSRVAARAADLHANPGESIALTGEAAYYWTVLAGEVEVVQRLSAGETQLTTFDPGESWGEIQLVLGAPALADIRALTPVRMMRVDALDFHVMYAQSVEVREFIAATIKRRVQYHSGIYLNHGSTAAAVVGDRS